MSVASCPRSTRWWGVPHAFLKACAFFKNGALTPPRPPLGPPTAGHPRATYVSAWPVQRSPPSLLLHPPPRRPLNRTFPRSFRPALPSRSFVSSSLHLQRRSEKRVFSPAVHAALASARLSPRLAHSDYILRRLSSFLFLLLAFLDRLGDPPQISVSIMSRPRWSLTASRGHFSATILSDDNNDRETFSKSRDSETRSIREGREAKSRAPRECERVHATAEIVLIALPSRGRRSFSFSSLPSQYELGAYFAPIRGERG